MNTPTKTINERSILEDLDGSNLSKFFIDLEHPYTYTMGNRINLFADNSRWAIAFETTSYNPRDNAVSIEVNYFGNCLVNNVDEVTGQIFNTKWFSIVEPDDIQNISNNHLLTLPLRNQEIGFEKNFIDQYIANNELDFTLFIRKLDELNPSQFRARDEELYASLPADLPKIFTIDKWHYKRYDFYTLPPQGDKPSSYETFQLIARILVTGDTTLWKPTLPANNNWRNYPKAGSL